MFKHEEHNLFIVIWDFCVSTLNFEMSIYLKVKSSREILIYLHRCKFVKLREYLKKINFILI